MGVCSSCGSSNQVGSHNDVDQPRPIDPFEQPGKVAEIIYNSMRARPKVSSGVSPTDSPGTDGSPDPAKGALHPSGTLSSRAARHSSRNHSRKPPAARENMFDLSELYNTPAAAAAASPAAPAASASAAAVRPGTPSPTASARRLAFVHTAAERESSLQRELSSCGAPPGFARKASGTVSRANSDSDEDDGDPAELSRTTRSQRGHHARNHMSSEAHSSSDLLQPDISTRPLGFQSNSPESSRRKIKEVPFAQQVLQRKFEGALHSHDSDYTPAPYKSVNTDSPIFNARVGAPENIPSLNEDATAESASQVNAPSQTPTAVSATKIEKLWTHYAGKDSKYMYKKGLRQLSEDVYDEFVQKYKAKLFEINQPAYEKKGEVYTDERADHDLAVDLPILLPVANKKPSRDDFVKYMFGLLYREMSKSSGGTVKAYDSESSVSHSHGHGHGHGDHTKLSKVQFVLGWNHAHEELFHIIDRIKSAEGHNASPCKLM